MAEAHPVGFRWVMKAKEHGATIIHVDPRFSRTSALADIWVPIRAGHGHRVSRRAGAARARARALLPRVRRPLHERLVHSAARTSATRRRATGYFSGWDEEKRAYEPKSWLYEGEGLSYPKRDLTLQHPRCVFQILRRHFARYTPEMVEKVCGIPPELFHKVADALTQCLRSGEDGGDLLRGRLDAALERRADHPHRRDPAALARQYRPARRRHHGAARARFDPGLDRYPDALRCAARLPRDAARRQRRGHARSSTSKKHTNTTGLWHQFPELLHQPAEGLLRRARDAGERLRLRLAAEDHRRPFATSSFLYADARRARWKAFSSWGKIPRSARQNARLRAQGARRS